MIDYKRQDFTVFPGDTARIFLDLAPCVEEGLDLAQIKNVRFKATGPAGQIEKHLDNPQFQNQKVCIFLTPNQTEDMYLLAYYRLVVEDENGDIFTAAHGDITFPSHMPPEE